jgi:hypothetical protein
MQTSLGVSGPTLLKVENSTTSQFSLLENNSLSKTSLTSSESFLVLSGGGDIVKKRVSVWVGKNASEDHKKNAAANGFSYIRQNSLPITTALQVFFEGKESVAFKSQFGDWDDVFPVTLFSDALALSSIKLPRKMLDDHAKSVNHDVDEGGKVRVWRVDGVTRVTMNKAICGQFYSSNCYILLYAYTPQGEAEKYILIYWIGLESSSDDKGSAAILTKYIGDSLEGKMLIIRVVEGQEPAYLRRLFRGALMVHRTIKRSSSPTRRMSRKSTSLLSSFSLKSKSEKGTNAVDQLSRMLQTKKSAAGTAELFAFVGSTALTLYALQVPLSSASLNNTDNFVLFTASNVYVRVSTPALQGAVVRLAATKVKEVDGKSEINTIVFTIGKEPEDFWSQFEGKSVDPNKPSYLPKSSEKSPKLYHATARSGDFRLSEVTQSILPFISAG